MYRAMAVPKKGCHRKYLIFMHLFKIFSLSRFNLLAVQAITGYLIPGNGPNMDRKYPQGRVRLAIERAIMVLWRIKSSGERTIFLFADGTL